MDLLRCGWFWSRMEIIMPANIVKRSKTSFTIQLEVPYSNAMLDGEENLQQSLNEAGSLATEEILKQFDTDGSIIEIGGVRFYPHGERESKEFQSPYGPVIVERYVYQSSQGGKRFPVHSGHLAQATLRMPLRRRS